MSEVMVTEASDALAWDTALCAMHGAHPLQSWEWGEAKRAVGEPPLRLLFMRGGEVVGLTQCFLKKATALRIPVAWLPRAPVIAKEQSAGAVVSALRRELKSRGIKAAVAQPYLGPQPNAGWKLPFHKSATFVLDLSLPAEDLERNLHEKWRYNKNRFHRRGGTVAETKDPADFEHFVEAYAQLLSRKEFAGYGTPDFMRAVWRAFQASAHPQVSLHLFHAFADGQPVASAVVARVGSSMHELWAAFDFDKQQLRASEAVLWAAVLALREQGVRTFDLEGADEKNNPGVFRFKRHMGGKLVELPRPRLLLTGVGG